MLQISNMVTDILTSEDTVRVVDGLSLELSPGEFCALVGESGCGKSMTAFSLLRLLPSTGRVTSGVVTVDGTEIMGLPESMMRHIRSSKISLIFQEPATSLNPVMTVGDQIVETIELHTALRGVKARAKALEWLKKVGIPEPERRIDSFPHELSGGQRQRVMIAIALAAQPKYLIADEPTTALDVTIQAQILDLIKSLRDSENIGVLLITHDLTVVAQVADRVGLMYAGELVEEASAQDFFSSPYHPYARNLLKALPEGKDKSHPLQAIPGMVPRLNRKFVGCRFADRCTEARAECRRGDVPLTDFGTRRVRCLFPIKSKVELPRSDAAVESEATEAGALLQVRDYNVWFPTHGGFLRRPDYVKAVQDVSFDVLRGRTTALVGESGSGKTTVARGVLQLLRSAAHINGSARLDGTELSELKGQALLEARRRIQVIFQDPFSSLNPRMRVKEILLEGLESLRSGTSASEAIDRAESAVNLCGLRSDSLYRYPHEFSGGQRQRLAIARALLVEPELLICDEPTSALDVSVQAQILNLLNEIQKNRGISYLFITHNFSVVRYLADDVIVMKDGRVVESGTAAEVLNTPREVYTQNLLNAVPNFDALRQKLGK
ncbi:dipeptide ABC transporter ATP-binding protein [Parasutterella muris]|uniref:Oligopeptide ABC transporter ATP-binding protein OppD n=1 Tax=Parasutterella muris TaxID=2565572 RepID=A0A6L6YIB2_9BURK|nr:dipeptide ABC transporter ATP-binding protein [Parasutterella muris]MVX57387.1 oligopeptide ABC transporter ATP-binding protein OppD [Parasutterella muris]